MSTLDDLAIEHHELYLSYIRAGFKHEQAMELVKAHLAISKLKNDKA